MLGGVKKLLLIFLFSTSVAFAAKVEYGQGTLIADKISYQDKKISLEKASFTQCDCDDGKIPAWQISAKSILVNQVTNKASYKNAVLRLYGVPVLYTPVLGHIIDRKQKHSGLLIPKYSRNQLLGVVIELPIFINLKSNLDVELTPIITTLEGLVLDAKLRHLTKYGRYDIKAAITNPKNPVSTADYRYYYAIDGQLDKATFSINRASDTSFMQKYNYSEIDVLRSNLAYETEHLRASLLGFQSLNSIRIKENTPLVMPQVSYQNKYKSINYKIFGSNIQRQQGLDSSKLIVDSSYNRKLLTSFGHLFDYGVRLRLDGYYTSELENRVIPTMFASWQLPLIKKMANSEINITPIFSIDYSSNNHNKSWLQVEDSLGELSDTNFFSGNRFSGYDIVEEGLRVNYGGKLAMRLYENNFAAFFGQGYRSSNSSIYSNLVGYSNQLSDYVGRLSFSNNFIKDLSWNYILASDSGKIRKSEVIAFMGKDRFNFSLVHTLVNDDIAADDKNELYGNLFYKINDKYGVNANFREDINANSWINYGAKLTYSQKCISLGLKINRNFFTTLDIRPDTSVGLEVSLKTY
jgi:LPS-assembly protein